MTHVKNIRFAQGKYVFPLFALPVLLVGFYAYQNSFAGPRAPVSALESTESINVKMPEANLERRQLKNKLESFQDAYQTQGDYSAVQSLDEVTETKAVLTGEPDEDERLLDSLQTASLKGERLGFMAGVRRRQRVQEERAPPRHADRPRRQESDQERELRLFREQLALIDSLSAGAPEVTEAEADPGAVAPVPPPAADPVSTVQKVAGRRALARSGAFHTFGRARRERLIEAILDEGLKVEDGSRVRIRLLEPILVEDLLLERGEYLYALVTGFSAQRVNLTVNAIMVDGRPLPVDLEVFDQDGMAGLYVPASQFQQLKQDLYAGAAGSGGQLDVGGSPDNRTEVFYEIADRLIQSGSRAAQRAARRNRAKLKYNTVVYLSPSRGRASSSNLTP